MDFTVRIHTDNAAFEDGNREHETARILRDISNRLDGGGSFEKHQTLRDINGNDVGRAVFTRE